MLLHTHRTSAESKDTKTHPLCKLRLYKEAMWNTSRDLTEEIKNQPPKRSTPKNEEELLSHMIHTIHTHTKHQTNKTPE